MMSKKDFAAIKTLNKRGVYQKDIAEQVGVHPRTVSNSYRNGDKPLALTKGALLQEKLFRLLNTS